MSSNVVKMKNAMGTKWHCARIQKIILLALTFIMYAPITGRNNVYHDFFMFPYGE